MEVQTRQRSNISLVEVFCKADELALADLVCDLLKNGEENSKSGL